MAIAQRRVGTLLGAALAAALVATMLSWIGPALPAAQAASPAVVVTFSGAPTAITVPLGATSVRVTARGGSGERAQGFVGSVPGAGAVVAATFPVTPGETLLATVGGNASRSTGGYNGGADGYNPAAGDVPGAGGGGGATDLRIGGTLLEHRVLVAGGGGGAAMIGGADGGRGGTVLGGAGITGAGCQGNSLGGTLVSGGEPGWPCGGTVGEAGSRGLGGLPGYRAAGRNMGGGGGGGFFGGGGGSPFGGGGGGSSYVSPTGKDDRYEGGSVDVQPSMQLTFTIEPTEALILGVQPFTLVADGVSTTTVTALALGAAGNPISGETVRFTSSDRYQRVSETVDRGDGSYSAVVTSSTSLGVTEITATAGPPSQPKQGRIQIWQVTGPPVRAEFVKFPGWLPADGETVVDVVVTVRDATGHPVPGQSVMFSSSDVGQRLTPLPQSEPGTHGVSVRSSTRAGAVTIYASVNSGPPDAVSFWQLAGAAAILDVELADETVFADGVSGTVVTASLFDRFRNPVGSGSVEVTSETPGVTVGPVRQLNDGRFEAAVTSATRAGSATLRVVDRSVTPALERTVTLSQVPGPAHTLTAGLGSGTLVADGVSGTTLSAAVADAHGNPIAGRSLRVESSDPGVHTGPVRDFGDGNYAIDVVASKASGEVTLTVVDPAASPELRQPVTLTQVAGEATAATLEVGGEPALADGVAERIIRVAAVDAHGNAVPGLPIGASSTDAGHRFSQATEVEPGIYELSLRASKRPGPSTVRIGVVRQQTSLDAVNALRAVDTPDWQESAILARVLATVDLEQRAVRGKPTDTKKPDASKNPAAPAKQLGQAGTGPSTPEQLARSGAADAALPLTVGALLAAGGVLLAARRSRRG